jgi:hypothetical protein
MPLTPAVADLLGIIDRFADRYPNPRTAESCRRALRQLFRLTGRRHPAELTEADLIAFCTCDNPAKNTVYRLRPPAATNRRERK